MYLMMLIQSLLCHMISHLLTVIWLHIHWFLYSILTCIHPALPIYFKQWYLYAILSLKRVFLMTPFFYVPPKQFEHPANLQRSSTFSKVINEERPVPFCKLSENSSSHVTHTPTLSPMSVTSSVSREIFLPNKQYVHFSMKLNQKNHLPEIQKKRTGRTEKKGRTKGKEK